MNKKILLTAIVVITSIIIFIILLNKPKYFIEEPLTYNGNKIVNTLNKPEYDTIFNYVLIESGVTNASIYVVKLETESETLKGQAGIYKDKIVLFLKDDLYGSDIHEIIAHEVAHVKQLHTKDLVNIDGDNVIYKGKHYKLSEIEYLDRPWEIDAFNTRYNLKKYYK